ncbi:uncharacterized protein [Cherax quadricarinatus]
MTRMCGATLDYPSWILRSLCLFWLLSAAYPVHDMIAEVGDSRGVPMFVSGRTRSLASDLTLHSPHIRHLHLLDDALQRGLPQSRRVSQGNFLQKESITQPKGLVDEGVLEREAPSHVTDPLALEGTSTVSSFPSQYISFGCQLQYQHPLHDAVRVLKRKFHNSREEIDGSLSGDAKIQQESYTSESTNDSETVLENIERMVISFEKRDTMRMNSKGQRVGLQQLYTKTFLHDSRKTKRIRHRRHKETQMENQPLKHVDTLTNLLPSLSEGGLGDIFDRGNLGVENLREEHDSVTEKDYVTNSDLFSHLYNTREKQRPVPVPSGSSAIGNKQVFSDSDKIRYNMTMNQSTSVATFPVRGYSEGIALPSKFSRMRINKPKLHSGKHIVDETFIKKMNFKGYQRRTEGENEFSTSTESSFIIPSDANNISNDLGGGVEMEFTNYVEEPVVLPTVETIELTEVSPPLPPISTNSRPVNKTISPIPHLPHNTNYPRFSATPGWEENSNDSVTSPEVGNTIVITSEEDLTKKSEGNEADRVGDANRAEETVTQPNAKNDTYDEFLDPAFIPAKFPFGPFIPSLRIMNVQEAPHILPGMVKKSKPFIIPDVQKSRKKPNTGDMMANILSPFFGNQQQKSSAKGHKLLEYDNERSHNEELYNQVSGVFMPDFGSRAIGFSPEMYPPIALIRRDKHRMFTSNKLHGGFNFIDRKRGKISGSSIMESPVGENPLREQNLVIFGNVKDNIMDTLRNCSRYISLQLIDHYSIGDLVRESSNPMRQLIVYFNIKSISFESYEIVLERSKRILDHLAMSQGGLTMYTVIPSQDESTNTTNSKEFKAQLLNLNDAILDYCAQNYPNCYNTFNLESITQKVKRTYNKDSGFNVYEQAGRNKGACVSNEVCGTASPTTSNSRVTTNTVVSPEQQLKNLVKAVCLSSYHLLIELEANMPIHDFEELARALENGKGERLRVRAQTGLVLHDILPRDLKKYDKNRPPKYEGHATIVYFHVTVLSVDSINEESMTYVADIFLAQSWRDHRLRLPENMTEEYRILDVEWLHNIWRPDCFFKNAKRVTFHEMSVPNHYLWLYHDKTLLYMAKLTLVLSCAMKFEAYPHDTQICSMMIESLSHTTHDLVFKWNETDPLVVNPDIELPQLDISRNNTEDCTLTYSTGNFTCLAVVFNLRRRLGYHLFHTYVPSAITVVMSWISFWIKPEAIPARVTLGVTSLLTLATQNQQSQSSLPPVSYIKAIDVWMSSCTVFVFASLLQFGIVNYFMETEPLSKDMTGYSVEDLHDLDEKKSEDARLNGYSRSRSRSRSRIRSHSPGVPQYVVHRCSGKDIALYIDKFSRLFFPFAFFILNVSYWTTYGTM